MYHDTVSTNCLTEQELTAEFIFQSAGTEDEEDYHTSIDGELWVMVKK